MAEEVAKPRIDDITPIVEWVKAKFNELIAVLKITIRKHDFGSIWAAIMLLTTIIEEAALRYIGLTGAQKKEILVKVLNDFIDIPVIPESVEGWMISFMVDQVIGWYNKIHGKKWGEPLVKAQARAIQIQS